MNIQLDLNLVRSILNHIQQTNSKKSGYFFDFDEPFVHGQTMGSLFDVLRGMAKVGYIRGQLVDEVKREEYQNLRTCFRIWIMPAGYNFLYATDPEQLEKALLELVNASFPLPNKGNS